MGKKYLAELIDHEDNVLLGEEFIAGTPTGVLLRIADLWKIHLDTLPFSYIRINEVKDGVLL